MFPIRHRTNNLRLFLLFSFFFSFSNFLLISRSFFLLFRRENLSTSANKDFLPVYNKHVIVHTFLILTLFFVRLIMTLQNFLQYLRHTVAVSFCFWQTQNPVPFDRELTSLDTFVISRVHPFKYVLSMRHFSNRICHTCRLQWFYW